MKNLLNIALLVVAGTSMAAAPQQYAKFTTHQQARNLMAKYIPANPVILEAGAYDGTDTIDMLKLFPGSIIYTFEPIPYLYKKVVDKIKGHTDRVSAYNYALSDSSGTATMYVSEESYAPNIPSQSSSLLAPKDHLVYSATQFKQTITVPTITIDEWAKQERVDHIDVMWLDMQGYELNALKAAPEILKTVKVILTEIEFVEAYAGQYLFKDVKNWLEEQGFTLVAMNTSYGWFGDGIFVRLQ